MSILSILDTLFLGPLKLVFEIIFIVTNQIVNHPGISIIILSLAMNILVLPLYRRADAMQEEARDKEAKIADGVAHIKKVFSGDERMMMLQAYYRQNNYKPTDSLGGAVSLLLQVPFFMAAYQFLSNASILNGVSFGPINDLGAPDGLIVIGGIAINALPIIMTLVNVISSAIYLKGFPIKTKIQLYGMALFFLVFLYTSPSGLVFYWTLNNIFSLVKTIFYKLKNPKKVLAILLSVLGLAFLVFGLFIYNTDFIKRKLLVVAIGVMMQIPLIVRIATPHIKPRVKKPFENAKLGHFISGALLLTVLIGVLIPSTYIAASPQEYVNIAYFHNPVNYILQSLLLAAGTFLVWLGVFYWLASPKGKVIFIRFIWILCCVMVINYMFFGTNLGIISSELKYDSIMTFGASELVLNLFVIVIATVAVYFISTKFPRVCSAAILTLTLALGVMTGTNIVTINKSVNELTKDSYVLGEPAFELTNKGQNVIVLMLDRAAGEYIPYIFNEKPELKEQFSGFTHYDNVISFGAATRFSVPSLYGGYEYTPVEMNKRDDELLVDKHNEALKVMPALFDKNGYKVSVCNPPYANYQWIPDMSIYDDYPDINTITTDVMYKDVTRQQQVIKNNYRNFFCFSVMKSMPVFLQPTIYDDGNYNRMKEDNESTGVQIVKDSLHAEGINWRFQSNYEVLKNMPDITKITSAPTNTMLSMMCEITHAPTLLQMPDYVPSNSVDNTKYVSDNGGQLTLNGKTIKLETQDQITHYHVNMATMIQLGNWFDYLRESGVYDNTRIILVSDHSWPLFSIDDMIMGEQNEMLKNTEAYYPLLMVKDFGAKEFSSSSEFMTLADVPTLATDDLIDNPKNPFTGIAINDDEKKAHEQYVFVAWDGVATDGNTFHADKWASVSNDMRNPKNWTFYDGKYILKEHKIEN